MNNWSKVAKFIVFASIFTSTLQAQTTGQPSVDDLLKRIEELEKQLRAISVELVKLQNANEPSAATKPVSPVAETVVAQTAAVTPAKAEPAGEKKKDLGVDVGNARLTPYGTVFFNAFSNSGGTNNADVPIFATPTGTGNFSASVRQTRLGVRLEGARVGNARLAAVIEGDFFGGFPSIGIGENMGVFRIRLANARLDWERTSVTVGQDWMVFAPVNPISMATAGNPQLAAAGNNWARLPQVRIDQKIGDHLTWQGAILAPQTGDFAANAAFAVQPTSGAASNVPFFQSRFAYSNKAWFRTKKPGSIAISAHYGQSKVFTGTANVKNDIESFGVALDWNFPLTERLSLLGEAFFGRNLGGFQAGVFQSYNNDFAYRQGSTLVAGGVRSIGTRGGWVQLGYTPPFMKDRLGIYGSLGIDDPNDKDLVTVSNREWRTRNLVFAGNLVYRFTPQFSVGAEFRRIITSYLLSGRRNSNHVNLGATYSF